MSKKSSNFDLLPRGVNSVNVKKNAQKLAYVQFLLYLCSRFGKDQAFGR